MEATVNVRQQDGKSLASAPTAAHASTKAFEHTDAEADERVQRIIQANLGATRVAHRAL